MLSLKFCNNIKIQTLFPHRQLGTVTPKMIISVHVQSTSSVFSDIEVLFIKKTTTTKNYLSFPLHSTIRMCYSASLEQGVRSNDLQRSLSTYPVIILPGDLLPPGRAAQWNEAPSALFIQSFDQVQQYTWALCYLNLTIAIDPSAKTKGNRRSNTELGIGNWMSIIHKHQTASRRSNNFQLMSASLSSLYKSNFSSLYIKGQNRQYENAFQLLFYLYFSLWLFFFFLTHI